MLLNPTGQELMMNYLNTIPKFLFFTGKGGVGKTSLSCATAIRLADEGKRILLVSTDPASNVGQVFGQQIGNTLTVISDVPGLTALEIDPQAAAQQYRARIVDPVKGILPEDVVRSIEEQLSGACTTEIAAFDEFTGLLTDDALLNDFDHVIFDTAPTGHTIRLLQLPGAWSSFIETNPDGASCLGPLAGLEKQRERYSHALSVLADGEKTRLILVARAQQSTLAEVARTHDELLHVGLKHQYLVINGIMPAGEASEDSLASALYQREQRILSHMPQVLASLPTDRLSQQENLVGVTALRRLLTGENKPCSLPAAKPVSEPLSVPSLEMLIDDIARGGHGLVMLMGKGGVGKTTLAACGRGPR
jgi:arsenite-transporting ATPase